MNAIHKINAINKQELERNVPDHASWHADYSDTSYIYIGNLHESLAEKDILAIFSQYGNPTHINLVKNKETGKPRGFCYLKYEDQRSCVLAIDNFNGVLIYERPLKVDHTYYKLAPGQTEDDFKVEYPSLEKQKAKAIEPPKPVDAKVSSPKMLEASEEHEQEPAPAAFDDDDFADPMANLLGVSASHDKKSSRSSRSKRHSKSRSELDHDRKHKRLRRDGSRDSHKRKQASESVSDSKEK